MADLPDYYTQTAIAEAEAVSFDGGLDANKPDDPVSRDIYLATDTHILYVCFTDGAWTGFDAAILTQGILKLYENMNANSKKIINLAAPTLANDAVRKAYVDAIEAYTDEQAVAAVEAAGLILAAAKKIVFANDGKAQFGVLGGSPNIFGGLAGDPTALIVQPKDGNLSGKVYLVPSGTGDEAFIVILNSSDLANFGYVTFGVTGGIVTLAVGAAGGGEAPADFRSMFTIRPYTDESQGLGNDSYWWKHIKAQYHHIRSSLGDAHSWSGIVTTDITAGENLVFGDAVYMKSDGKAWKSDADGAATMPIFGIAVATINAEAAGEILTQGWIRDDSWSLTAGGIVYASVTAGAISTTAPVGSGDQVQVIGIAKTTALIHFNPSYELVEIS